MATRIIERNTNAPDHVIRIVVHRPSVETGFTMTKRTRIQSWEYPYDDMNIGDSFHVMCSETTTQIVASRISMYNQKNTETKFSCRTQLNEDGEKLTRIWRVK